MTDGRLNRLLGWLLLTITFIVSGRLDPFAMGITAPEMLVGSLAMHARHAQAVALGMGFLQLLIGILLSRLEPRRPAFAFTVSVLSALGALLYLAGYLLMLVERWEVILAVVGALLGCLAVLSLRRARFAPGLGVVPRVVVGVLACGLLLDAFMALGVIWDAAVYRGWVLPYFSWRDWLGEDDGVQLRMLRLARAAMIALSLISMLYAEELERSRPASRWLEWAAVVLVSGAAGMVGLLILAATLSIEFKYLLGLPANAAVVGVAAGAELCFRRGARQEFLGWLLILVSMCAGLLMGLYAFDGPVPDPPFIGSYLNYPRRLTRLGHAYVIIFGLLLICLRRDLRPTAPRLGVWLVGIGGLITVANLAFTWGYQPWLPVGFVFGPALVGSGLLLCLIELLARGWRDAGSERGA